MIGYRVDRPTALSVTPFRRLVQESWTLKIEDRKLQSFTLCLNAKTYGTFTVQRPDAVF